MILLRNYFLIEDFFLRQGLSVLPRLECHGVTTSHDSLDPGSGSPSTSVPWVAGTTGTHHQTQHFFFFVETGFHYISQAGLELLVSGDPPASASQGA